MRRFRFLAIAFASMSLLVTACGGDDEKSSSGSGGSAAAQDAQQDDVLVQFTFKVRGEYAHLYVADEKGFFKEEGIKVSFREGQGAEPVLASLSSQGGKTFVVAAMNQAAAAITKGLPLVSVATWEPKVPSVLVAKPSTKLDGPESLKGKTIGLKQGQNASLMFKDFLTANGLSESDVKVRMLDSAAANAVFLKGDVDAVDAFLTNEVPTLQAEIKDGTVNTLSFADHGFPDLGIGVIVKKDLTQSDPDLVTRFLRASSRGVEAMKANPEEAASIIKARYAAVLPDESVVLEQVKSTIEHMPQQGSNPYGYIDASKWEAAIETAKKTGVIEKPLPVEQYFTNEFLK